MGVKNDIPHGYKQTELGIIPEDWEVASFSHVFDIYPNNTYPRDCMNNNYGVVRNVHYGDVLIKYPTIVDAERCQIPYLNECIKIKTQKFLQTGDIIIADTAEDDTVGKCVEIVNDSNSKVVAGLHTFFCRPSIPFATGWLGYYLNSSNYHNQLLPYITGIKVSSISKSSIQETKILVPSISEQKAIAEALSDVDDLIAALDKKIAKKRLLKQGAMQQLLTGKKRLPGFTDEWAEKKLGEIGTLAMCKRVFCEETSDSGDVPFYKIGTFGQEADAFISKAKFEQFKNVYRFPNKGDILISAAGTIGRTVVYNGEPAYFQDSNIVWLAHNQQCILNEYLYYVYQVIEWNTENTTIARLYNDNFNNTSITFPKSLAEQQTIATILSDMDKEIADLEAKRDKYRLLKSGMMQKLLTGQVRLRNRRE